MLYQILYQHAITASLYKALELFSTYACIYIHTTIIIEYVCTNYLVNIITPFPTDVHTCGLKHDH